MTLNTSVLEVVADGGDEYSYSLVQYWMQKIVTLDSKVIVNNLLYIWTDYKCPADSFMLDSFGDILFIKKYV